MFDFWLEEAQGGESRWRKEEDDEMLLLFLLYAYGRKEASYRRDENAPRRASNELSGWHARHI